MVSSFGPERKEKQSAALFSSATHVGFHSNSCCRYSPGVSAADSPISANTTAKVLYACNPNAEFSTCCKAGETCGTDLLCHNSDGIKVARQYCTDPTWKTDQCSRLCP
ncbi:MAG: hypothetical protein Q9223_007210, partial [Gallowayella weberi]